jgi:hypothetical protein
MSGITGVDLEIEKDIPPPDPSFIVAISIIKCILKIIML